MENLTRALYMAVAMMLFVLAFSVTLYLVNKVNTTAKTLVYSIEASYYDSLTLNELIENNEDRNRSRIVGVDSIIPTLYRYYKESFAVKILDVDGKLLQYFDTTTEGDVNRAKMMIDNTIDPSLSAEEIARLQKMKNKNEALLSLYDNSGNVCNMFGAPWLATINKDAKVRVDMYIYGKEGYINNTYVDYTSNNLMQYKDRQFKEVFTQYAYEGDTVSVGEGEELVTLTGSKQISTKIIITYQLLT